MSGSLGERVRRNAVGTRAAGKKLRPKFAATTPGCSMAKIALLDDAFLEVF